MTEENKKKSGTGKPTGKLKPSGTTYHEKTEINLDPIYIPGKSGGLTPVDRGFAKGIDDSFDSAWEGIVTFISDPIENTKNLWHAATNPGETWDNVRNSMSEYLNENWTNGDLESRSMVVGRVVGEVLVGAISAKGTDKLLKATKAGKVASQAAEKIRVGARAALQKNPAGKLLNKSVPIKLTKKEILEANRRAGRLFELSKLKKFSKYANGVEEQLTIRIKGTPIKLRIDAIGFDKKTGKIIIQEYKSSETASFTLNQRIGFPLLEKNGAVVVGKGKGAFKPGTSIDPVSVDVVRPSGVSKFKPKAGTRPGKK